MAHKSPEDELAEFLASQPSWCRKLLLGEEPSKDEALEATRANWVNFKKTEERYMALLAHCPGKLREFRERLVKNVLTGVPSPPIGRPKTPDSELEQLLALERAGLNDAQIARKVGLTKETVRKRLEAARKRIKPE